MPTVSLPHPARKGRTQARLFRQYCLPPEQQAVRACDLDAILAEEDLEVCESALPDCGYAACLLRSPDGKGGGIMVAADQHGGRRRFSMAHELAHYHLHSDVGRAQYCVAADMVLRQAEQERIHEWEANDFATELLMPSQLFRQDIARRDVSFEIVMQLAAPGMYETSITAAALRLVELSRDACVLILSTDGRVDWSIRSEAWRYPLPERRFPLPRGSVGAAVICGEVVNQKAEPVNPQVWLASADGRTDPPHGVELYESTHVVPRLRQVLSLLWVVGDET